MTVLRVSDVDAGYGQASVLEGVSLELEEGEILSIIGPNGAGKTTLMRVLMGMLEPTDGMVHLLGEEVTGEPPHARASRGLSLVPEGRKLFRDLSVRENLVMGAYARRARRDERLQRVYDLFPRLSERRSQSAGTLSGGEAQMLAIGRSLMADPTVLLLDEPSMGLAPKLIPELFGTIEAINEGGVSLLLVEQRAKEAIELAHRGCLLENGTITHRGAGTELLENEDVIEKYLGGA